MSKEIEITPDIFRRKCAEAYLSGTMQFRYALGEAIKAIDADKWPQLIQSLKDILDKERSQ